MWVREAANNDGDMIQLVSPVFTESGFVYIKVHDLDGDMNETRMYLLTISGARLGYVPPEQPVVGEQENNNVIADSNKIVFDTTVSSLIGDTNDEDWYRFDLPLPGIVRTRLLDVPANLRLRVRLFQDDGQQIDYREATNPGDSLAFDTRITRPGVYYVLIDGPSRNQSSTEPYHLTLSVTTMEDVYEPKNLFGDAAILKDRNRIQALIYFRPG